MNLHIHQFLVSFFEKQHLYLPICLCHIWIYYCRLFPGTSWLFVSIVFLQFDSQFPSLSSNDSFSILINFFNYFNFSFISFIGCTGFLRLFVCLFLLFVLLCIFFVVLLFVSSFLSALLYHSFFSLIFTFFLYSFFYICSYKSVSVFILSLYLLILATILAPFCVFFFCLYFTQFIVVEKVNGSLSYTIGLCSVHRPYMNLLNFIVYYHNKAK